MYLKIFISILTFFLFLHNTMLSQWKNISPPNRKEKLYSLDIKQKLNDFIELNSEDAIDTILAVGWSSTQGAYFISFDEGKNWWSWSDGTFFPFSAKFSKDYRFFAVGYNFLSDNAEVKIFDFNGNQLETFSFDGSNLPYVKNFFDCVDDDRIFIAVGYGGYVFQLDKLSQNWKIIFVDSNTVLTKVKAFREKNDSTNYTSYYFLGGNSYYLKNRIYFFNEYLDECKILFDFSKVYNGVEIADFYFPSRGLNAFPIGFVVGNVYDTIVIWRSNPQTETFEKVFSQQSSMQPICVFSIDNGKTTFVLFDDGRILFSDNFGENWTLDAHFSSKQLIGANISFKVISDTNYINKKIKFYGFGQDGFVAVLEKNNVLGIFENLAKEVIFDEIEVYDLLGNLIFRSKELYEFSKITEKIPSGIYFVSKKYNKQVIDFKGVIIF